MWGKHTSKLPEKAFMRAGLLTVSTAIPDSCRFWRSMDPPGKACSFSLILSGAPVVCLRTVRFCWRTLRLTALRVWSHRHRAAPHTLIMIMSRRYCSIFNALIFPMFLKVLDLFRAVGVTLKTFLKETND